MHRQSRQTGFTLIELLLVIILLGILLAGSSNILKIGFNAFFTGKNIINANWQASIALERITRDLRDTKPTITTTSSATAGITIAAANSIAVNDMYGNQISYQVIGNQLIRNKNGTSQAIADGIQSISFSYYSSTAPTALIPLPLSATLLLSVRYLVITLNMNYNNLIFPITTAVSLWNIT